MGWRENRELLYWESSLWLLIRSILLAVAGVEGIDCSLIPLDITSIY